MDDRARDLDNSMPALVTLAQLGGATLEAASPTDPTSPRSEELAPAMTLDSLVWGDIGTWFAGIATFLAVVVAIYYSQRQERRTSRQALANVYAWVEHRTDSGEWRLVVSNSTDAPLYRWTVRFRWTVDGLDDTDEVGNDDIGIIPPGRHTYSLTSADGLPDNDGLVRVSIRFVDATGQGWLRTESGDLTPTAYPAAAA